MAVNAAQIGHSSSKKSHRIRAANKFLSNISLDGSVGRDNIKKGKEKTKPQATTLDEEDKQSLSNVNNLLSPLRPKLLTSFSATNATDDEENLDPSASSTTTCQRNNSFVVSYNRAMSLRDSNNWPNNVTHITSRNLEKSKRLLPGKRLEKHISGSKV